MYEYNKLLFVKFIAKCRNNFFLKHFTNHCKVYKVANGAIKAKSKSYSFLKKNNIYNDEKKIRNLGSGI